MFFSGIKGTSTVDVCVGLSFFFSQRHPCVCCVWDNGAKDGTIDKCNMHINNVYMSTNVFQCTPISTDTIDIDIDIIFGQISKQQHLSRWLWHLWELNQAASLRQVPVSICVLCVSWVPRIAWGQKLHQHHEFRIEFADLFGFDLGLTAKFHEFRGAKICANEDHPLVSNHNSKPFTDGRSHESRTCRAN